jgi:hypothetical protein
MPVQHDQQDEFVDERDRIAQLFTRGRFTQAEDGTCILTSRIDPGATSSSTRPMPS